MNEQQPIPHNYEKECDEYYQAYKEFYNLLRNCKRVPPLKSVVKAYKELRSAYEPISKYELPDYELERAKDGILDASHVVHCVSALYKNRNLTTIHDYAKAIYLLLRWDCDYFWDVMDTLKDRMEDAMS